MTAKIIEMYTYHVNEILYDSSSKKIAIKILIYFVLVLMALVITVVPQMLSLNKQGHLYRARYPTDLKYILIWGQPKRYNKSNIFQKSAEFLPGQTMFVKQKCPHINCYITYDRRIVHHDEDFDAVIFDINEVKHFDIDNLNLTRDPYQLYIFRSPEPAEKYTLCSRDLDKFFNWTWTYRLDSDVPQPLYSIFDENNTIAGPKQGMKWIHKMKHKGQFSSKIKPKNKAVAWIVTKCKQKSKHRDFVIELRNELKGYNYTVDEFGRCGQQKCNSVSKCNKIIEQKYHFQLVLEDYFSEDYVTDKIVTAMAHVTIPIVVGAGDFRNFLPPGSYINAQSFDLKKLGALIDYLIKNRDMYEYFFDWKNHYYFRDLHATPVCQLCEKLNEKRTQKTYNHFRYWWNSEYKDICQRIHLYKMFNKKDI